MATKERKIYHGCQVWYVPIDHTTKTFGTPIQWYGATSSDEESDGDSNTIYHDNSAYFTTSAKQSRTLELEFAQILPEFAIDCLGDQISNEKIHVRDTSGYKEGAFMLLSDVYNDTQKTHTQLLEIYYKVVPAEAPTLEHGTDEEDITENPFKIKLNCLKNDDVVDKKGRPVDYYWIERTEANKAVFDGFVTSIIKPEGPATSTTDGGDE